MDDKKVSQNLRDIARFEWGSASGNKKKLLFDVLVCGVFL